MKNFYLIILSTILPLLSFGQLNVSYVGQIDYDQRVNDIWGYAAPDGIEYALVGTNTGFSIVSLADPENPTEIFFIAGGETTWRDIKTWETYAYVVCDSCNDGLLVVDLSDLPNSIEHQYLNNFSNGNLNSSHNIFIDEFGYAYMSGTNLADVFFMDCFTDPYNPTFVADAPTPYAHDIYTRDNIMYTSEIYLGHFAVYDVTDKQNIVLLGSASTPFLFTHNAWLSDDSKFLFTTDERANAPIASYDVSDPTDIKELDQFLSLESRGAGTIPHNVHVLNDYIIASYYTDGCIIIDASKPDNLIEVGNFDTFLPNTVGSSGSWGAYPFLPSGKILVTDRDNGLFVLQPDYKRAAFLEGQITDVQTGDALEEATINILAYDREEYSNSFGKYKSGIPDNGTFDVEISRPLYKTETVSVELSESETTILDVALEPLNPLFLTVSVVEKGTGNPIPNAKIRILNDVTDMITSVAGDGFLYVPEFFPYDTEFYAGEWGYKGGYVGQQISANNAEVIIELEKGYQDNFAVDLGWQNEGLSNSGEWELGIPNEYNLTAFNLDLEIIPSDDSAEDPGNFALMTDTSQPDFLGNILGVVGTRSPIMEMSTWQEPTVSFYYWYFNLTDPNLFGFPQPGASLFEVFVSNGTDEVKMDEKKIESLESVNWELLEYKLADYIDITDQMQIMVQITAEGGQDITEGLLDYFNAWDADLSSISALDNANGLQIFPNPASDDLNLIIDESYINSTYEVSNILGMKILEGNLNAVRKTIDVQNLHTGAYIIRLKDEKGNDLVSKKFIKQ